MSRVHVGGKLDHGQWVCDEISGGEMGVVAYYERTQQEGRDLRQEGGKEANPRAGRSRGVAQRPTAPPLNGACDKPPAPPARWPPRTRTTKQERAQPERASGRTWQLGASNAARAMARRAVSAHPHGPSASHARLARREGGSEGHSSPHPTTPRAACTRACCYRMRKR